MALGAGAPTDAVIVVAKFTLGSAATSAVAARRQRS
jgi:hypothetical protein